MLEVGNETRSANIYRNINGGFLAAGTMIAIVFFFKERVRAIGGQVAKRWLYGFVSNIGLAPSLVAKWASFFSFARLSWNHGTNRSFFSHGLNDFARVH